MGNIETKIWKNCSSSDKVVSIPFATFKELMLEREHSGIRFIRFNGQLGIQLFENDNGQLLKGDERSIIVIVDKS